MAKRSVYAFIRMLVSVTVTLFNKQQMSVLDKEKRWSSPRWGKAMKGANRCLVRIKKECNLLQFLEVTYTLHKMCSTTGWTANDFINSLHFCSVKIVKTHTHTHIHIYTADEQETLNCKELIRTIKYWISNPFLTLKSKLISIIHNKDKFVTNGLRIR